MGIVIQSIWGLQKEENRSLDLKNGDEKKEQEDQKHFTIITGGRSLRTFINFGT